MYIHGVCIDLQQHRLTSEIVKPGCTPGQLPGWNGWNTFQLRLTELSRVTINPRFLLK